MSKKLIHYGDFEINEYLNDLQLIASSTRLFSESKAPFFILSSY
jgi:hypothetical protein